MNNIPFPYFPENIMPPNPQFIYPNQNINLEEELKKLKIEIENLKIRLNKLENDKKKNFLQKDDGFYMI